MNTTPLIALILTSLASVSCSAKTKITVTFDLGRDNGQSFGSLFEAVSDDGSLVVGAGFQSAYNTLYRADRHAIQFFIRPTDAKRELAVEELPRPYENQTGVYLFGRDGTVYSTHGGADDLKAWGGSLRGWRDVTGAGGTHETMRIGGGSLSFGDSTVAFDGRTILERPVKGSYQRFFYANGHLCFYHVHRNDKPYRPYETDVDGFSRLYACPWTPRQPVVDLSCAATLTLPVVGEMTFAWGQLGGQIVTGSNIGGFYVFENGEWRTLLEPDIAVSYQLYSTLVLGDRLLMGQYPTGRVFEYDGSEIRDQEGRPPVLEGVSDRAREAQTTVIYGGDLMVGVWPWGELWRFNPDSREWNFVRRMFDHPALSDEIVHPYDVENRGNSPGKRWGQRVTSMIPNGPDLFIATSAKSPFRWDPKEFPFLAPDKWKSYGKVYRVTMPGHLAVPIRSTGPTTIEFIIEDGEIAILQDGKQLAKTTVPGSLGERIGESKGLEKVEWGDGIYGRFAGASIRGSVSSR